MNLQGWRLMLIGAMATGRIDLESYRIIDARLTEIEEGSK